MSVGRRLLEERERLGLSQAAFFTACGVSKKAQFNFENDHNMPGGAYLIAAAALGVDVSYVLTGQRAGGASAPPPPRAVSEGDRVLLENFHAAPAQVQAGIKTTLGAFADASTSTAKRKPKAA